ncbi:cell division protein ZapE [Isoptericola sp. NPDC056578]|uniref:cell division protein ZapE n=1 Tax=Isoptericola sp. NPDC056578 TaxID=3345870 RepID=UPI0036BEE62B
MWSRATSRETLRVRAALDDAAHALGSTLDAGQRAAADVLAAAGARVALGRRGRRGVYLHGPVGRGKTFLVDALLSALPPDGVLRVHAFEAARRLHAAVARESGNAGALPRALASLLDGTRVLFLDELHAHDPGDAMILSRLVREAVGRGIPLLATSNYPPDGLLPSPLHHHLVLPLVRSIAECCDVVEVAPGEDYRRRGHLADRSGWRAGAWVVPGSAAQVTALGLGTPDPGDRFPVRLPATALRTLAATGPGTPEGVVHLDFRELCEAPTSVGDVMDLVDRYGTLVVWRVPRLSATTADGAQRFANLVDVAWDRDVRLVVLATSPPDDVLDADVRDRDRIASRLAALPRV